MKNITVCKNCGSENPFYSLICSNCKAYLRTRIPNIDLWFTIGKVIESPIEAIKNIIYAEHKNFTIFLLILSAIKIAINSLIINNAIKLKSIQNENILNAILFTGVFFIITFTVAIFFIYLINNLFHIKNRIKDNFSIYTYSLIPIIFALIILTPVEYALFGHYWFTFNPSPFIIKTTESYILIIIEVIFLLWSLILFIISTYVQSKNIIYSFITGIILFILIFISPFIFLYYFV
ncbi:MAG: hypothetical protein QHH13_13840 [Melioribacter sp.]|uniref:hypothetical protein n=1 Tax=Rosettibacter primus TaxID=3111523 RepID=UPI00247B69DC|nr:hypothetical protein [Melioribacter sp.]